MENGPFMVDLWLIYGETWDNVGYKDVIFSIDLGKFDHDLTVLPKGIIVRIREIIPKLALFSLVNDYNLPRFIYSLKMVTAYSYI